MKRHWTVFRFWPATLLIVCGMQGMPSRAADARGTRSLSFHIESIRPVALQSERFSIVRPWPGGGLVFVAPDRWTVHRVSASGHAVSFNLHTVPETSHSTIRPNRDVAIDGSGKIYVPGNWFRRKNEGAPKAGVFVFEPDGRYSHTIELGLQGSPEHIAVDADGNIFVLGLEAGYIRGTARECRLLHRFAPDGKLLESFSPCPEAPPPGEVGRNQWPALRRRLSEEAERGDLFIRGGRLFHVLPLARTVRIFAGGSRLLQEVAFVPPASSRLLAEAGMRADPAGSRISRLVPLPDGRFLVEWLQIEPVGPSGQRRTTFLALHGPDGRHLSEAAHPPAGRPSIPIDCDWEGRVLFLHLNPEGSGRVELVRAALSLE